MLRCFDSVIHAAGACKPQLILASNVKSAAQHRAKDRQDVAGTFNLLDVQTVFGREDERIG